MRAEVPSQPRRNLLSTLRRSTRIKIVQQLLITPTHILQQNLQHFLTIQLIAYLLVNNINQSAYLPINAHHVHRPTERDAPDLGVQRRTVWSAFPEATKVPSGVIATLNTSRPTPSASAVGLLRTCSGVPGAGHRMREKHGDGRKTPLGGGRATITC